ncbi:MAG: C39 family peptidase [Ruminococcus sp.]|nr:C39 family peptidase [Ruminococcus sp.]
MIKKFSTYFLLLIFIGRILILPSFSVGAKDILNIMGDVNSDGIFNLSDIVTFQKWLLTDENATLDHWENADFCNDGKLDIFDLCSMQKSLLETEQIIEFNASYDMFSSGYTDAFFESNEENRIFTARSTNELREFLSIYFEEEIVFKYEEIYNDKFFEDSVLLLNVLFQSCGTEPDSEVTRVEYENKSLNVSVNKINFDVAEDVISALLIQVEISKYDYYTNTVKWQITETSEPQPPPVINENKKIIDVTNIAQYPELPTGCEVTSLTILLNHLGYKADKIDLARNYLPKQDFYWENGIYYGADFRTTFAGNPASEYSYGCYAPCIVTTANRYLNNIGAYSIAHNISGADFDSLLTDYIDNDRPVLIWITSSNLHESYLTSIWTTPAGEQVQWRAYEHCVVLTGYDLDNGLIYVSDPMYNNVAYDYDKIKLRYNEMGRQAVCIN